MILYIFFFFNESFCPNQNQHKFPASLFILYIDEIYFHHHKNLQKPRLRREKECYQHTVCTKNFQQIICGFKKLELHTSNLLLHIPKTPTNFHQLQYSQKSIAQRRHGSFSERYNLAFHFLPRHYPILKR